jgi:hypothetical protein
MRHADEEATELKHTQEVGFPVFPAGHLAAEDVERSNEPLNSPKTAVAPQPPTLLDVFPATIALVRCDPADAVFFAQLPIKRIAIVGRVADHSF